MEIFHQFFSNSFIPHGHCYLWKPGLVWLHVISDSLITLAYFSIPMLLVYMVKKRGDVPFDFLFMLFGSFIICCGITHLMEIWTLWHPTYWLSGFLKAVTAAISLCTAGVMVPLVPKVLAIPSPAQLKEANLALQKEISDRKQAENALSKLTLELEERVKTRTSALKQANELLQRENYERSLAEEALRRSQAQLQRQAQELKHALHQVKYTQAQLVHSEKMSSLGQMVAGIAHEINNPINFIYANIAPATEYLQSILSVVELYQKHYPQPPWEVANQIETLELDFLTKDFEKMLNSMKLGADRIRDIVKSLRTFSRLDEADKKKVNLHENIDSTLMILQHRLKAQPNRPAIATIQEYGELPLVECYASQLNQVFMNLLSNAIDALEQKLEEFGVSAQSNTPRENSDMPTTSSDSWLSAPSFSPTIHIRTSLVDAKTVQIQITDNGIGMTSEVMEKIYEPFYTTKPIGHGTGLGLAISYQIVQQNQGDMRCVSELGKGTEFVIEIPVTVQADKTLKKSIRLWSDRTIPDGYLQKEVIGRAF